MKDSLMKFQYESDIKSAKFRIRSYVRNRMALEAKFKEDRMFINSKISLYHKRIAECENRIKQLTLEEANNEVER